MNRQIFQAATATRWQRFKWGMRILLIILIVLIVMLVLALRRVYNPTIPQLREQGQTYKSVLKPGRNALLKESKLLRQFHGFRDAIRERESGGGGYTDTAGSIQQVEAPLRAAFYVTWDAQAFSSLKEHIARMNMVLPEWFFIDPLGDTLVNNLDQRALKLLQHSGVRTVPMLSNYFGTGFSGAAVHRILSDKGKTERLLRDIEQLLHRYKFQGINIDFEELVQQGDEEMTGFMQTLYARLHPQGLLVTQDVAPLNEDFNLKELAKCTDLIFLMSYDQHSTETEAGTICAQQWIEATVEDALHGGVPRDKLVLCLAGYAYDWPKGGVGADLTYAEALSTAAESEGKVVFDPQTYNLHYSYYDDNDSVHQVYFTDAATNYNTIRYAAVNKLAGVALWRLGSEDPRLWQFYLHDFAGRHTDTFDVNRITEIGAALHIDYEGEGEVLEVRSTPKAGNVFIDWDTTSGLITGEQYDSLPTPYVVKKFGKADKKLVLSFDDGPDPDYTSRILDILKKEAVPAVFFIVGQNAENNIPIVKRIYREGFEIGSHTFTHPNIALISENRAVLELNATRLLIECVTGHSTIMFRPPYNADSEPETVEEFEPVALASRFHYVTVGENIDPEDWETGVTADSIYNRILRHESNGNIILLHDAGGNREATIEALPRIIRHFREAGYTFTTVGGLVGRQRDDLMPPVPQGSGYYLIQFNYFLAELGYWVSSFFSSVFLICILLSVLRIVFLGVLAFRERRRQRHKIRDAVPPSVLPDIEIIVPAFNEEVNVVRAVGNLLLTTYPHCRVILVDDGSRDATYARATAAFAGEPRVQVLSKPNGGKASALNYGIAHGSAPFLVCIDADTYLQPDAIGLLMRHFTDEQVGAVAGNVKVGNEVNLLTRWQNIEYITSQNFDRLAFAHLNAVTVVPGAIGAFRKSAIEAAGGFTSDTLAEDCDLTIRLLRAGYRVANEEKAIARTEAPETIRMFLKQRIRWSFGVMQTFWKNRDTLFNPKYGNLGKIALPNILVFQFLIPLITPFADLLMLIGLITGNAGRILFFYGLFMLADVAVAGIAFLFEGERLTKLFWLIPQRLAYRWLMLYVLFKSYIRAIKGELQHWGILKRTGHAAAETLPQPGR